MGSVGDGIKRRIEIFSELPETFVKRVQLQLEMHASCINIITNELIRTVVRSHYKLILINVKRLLNFKANDF